RKILFVRRGRAAPFRPAAGGTCATQDRRPDPPLESLAGTDVIRDFPVPGMGFAQAAATVIIHGVTNPSRPDVASGTACPSCTHSKSAWPRFVVACGKFCCCMG